MKMRHSCALWVAVMVVLREALAEMEWENHYPLKKSTPRAVFSFTPSGRSGAVVIILQDPRGVLDVSGMYYLVMQNSLRGTSYLLKCRGRFTAGSELPMHMSGLNPIGLLKMPHLSREIVLQGGKKKICEFKMAFGNNGKNFTEWEEREYNFTVDALDGSIRIWMDDILYEWRDSLPIEIGYYILGTLGFDGKFSRIDSMTTTHYSPINRFFCSLSFTCVCDPGYEGDYCTNLCKEGRYGLGCKQNCGACTENSCDPITGECVFGCKPDFFPPLCQDTSVHLLEAPKATALNSSVIRVSADLSPSNLYGEGTPHLFQIQYKIMDVPKQVTYKWESLVAQPVEGHSATGLIAGLQANTEYEVRMQLFTDGNASYRDVNSTSVKTKCRAPKIYTYNLVTYGEKELKARWSISGMHEECRIKLWMLQVRNPGNKHWEPYIETKSQFAEFKRFMDGQLHEFRIQAVTISDEEIPFSESVLISSNFTVPSEVLDLRTTRVGAREIQIIWKPPSNFSHVTVDYHIDYKCENILSCDASCTKSGTKSHRPEPSGEHQFLLVDLQPNAIYIINLTTRVNQLEGPPKTIKAQTLNDVPDVGLEDKDVMIENVTKTSFIIKWKKSDNCIGFNGAFQGVQYVLLKEGNEVQPMSLHVGDEKHVFFDLVPGTTYQVRLYLQASGNVNPTIYTERTVHTKPLGPEFVRNLMVFKRERHGVNLRWSTPESPNGTLEYFNITYSPRGQNSTTTIGGVLPENCTLRRSLHCFKLSGLTPETNYNMSVQAVYSNKDFPGRKTYVQTSTVEIGPLTPLHLTVSNQTATSLRIEWNSPDILNGELRNFVITVHHLTSADHGDCCAGNRIFTINVTQQYQRFHFQVMDLRPASSYLLGIAGVTSVIGNVANITGYTAPAEPALGYGSLRVEDGPSGCLQITLPPIDVPQKIVQSHMVLIVPNREDKKRNRSPNITNSVISQKLWRKINRQYFIANYFPEVQPNRTVCLADQVIGTQNMHTGVLYRLALAVVLNYENLYAVATTFSEPFLVINCYESWTHKLDTKYMCF